MMAGGDVVMKSKASPRIPMPSLSIKNSGKLLTGGVIVMPISLLNRFVHSMDGIVVEISAPVVVVPLELEPT